MGLPASGPMSVDGGGGKGGGERAYLWSSFVLEIKQ